MAASQLGLSVCLSVWVKDQHTSLPSCFSVLLVSRIIHVLLYIFSLLFLNSVFHELYFCGSATVALSPGESVPE